jgi:predicted DNA-binding antitoxin AbrB/MazE fold protein
MNHSIDAIYENGVFRPEVPVNVANGERVSLIIASKSSSTDLTDVADLLDVDYMEACFRESRAAPELEDVRRSLSLFEGSVSDLVCEERDER